MRRARSFGAHFYSGVEIGCGIRVFVFGSGNERREIALRRGAEMIAIRRHQNIPESVRSRRQRLAPAVFAFGLQFDYAQEGPNRNAG